MSIRPTISFCMIVRDEEETLPDCLESIKDFADEIIVVDTGSTDRTVEIAESYDAKVSFFEWNDSFADAKNVAIEQAACDWVFVIDADERLNEKAKCTIRKTVIDGTHDAYSLCQRSSLNDKHTDYWQGPAIRLWRNKTEIRFRGRVHESVHHLVENGTISLANIDATIDHIGYLPEVIDRKHKDSRNKKLMRIEFDEDPDSLHYTFHLARSHHAKGNYEEALSHYEKALRLAPSNQRLLKIQICSSMATIYSILNDTDNALAMIDHAMALGSLPPDVLYTRGRVMIMLDEYAEALDCFRQAKEAGKSADALCSDLSIGEYKADWGISAALAGMNRFDDAADAALNVLKKKPDYFPARLILLVAYQAMEMWDDLDRYLLETHSSNPNYIEITQHLISVYASQGRESDAERIRMHLDECLPVANNAACC